MLTVKNLDVKVGRKEILSDFSFDFQKGKIYAIMGPNGSGKSTLAYALSGHPLYKITKGEIFLKGKNITDETADKRANAGIFLSFQNPLSLGGVRAYQLLQMAMEKKKSALETRELADKFAQELKISSDLLKRSLNEGASGGEKKKMEVLQAAVLNKDLQIFDEVDTGVDVDALKTIANFLHKHKNGKTYIVITHYNRILHYLKPDEVLIMINGKLKKVGNARLAEKIEKEGYAAITDES